MKRLLLFLILSISASISYGDGSQNQGMIEAYKSYLGISNKVLLENNSIKPNKIQMHDYVVDGLFYYDGNYGFNILLKDNISNRLIFRSNKFETQNGIMVGDNFCKVKKLHPNSKLIWGYDEGGIMRLHDENTGVIFDFMTNKVYWELYDENNPPSENIHEICNSKINEIYLI